MIQSHPFLGVPFSWKFDIRPRSKPHRYRQPPGECRDITPRPCFPAPTGSGSAPPRPGLSCPSPLHAPVPECAQRPWLPLRIKVALEPPPPAPLQQMVWIQILWPFTYHQCDLGPVFNLRFLHLYVNEHTSTTHASGLPGSKWSPRHLVSAECLLCARPHSPLCRVEHIHSHSNPSRQALSFPHLAKWGN